MYILNKELVTIENKENLNNDLKKIKSFFSIKRKQKKIEETFEYSKEILFWINTSIKFKIKNIEFAFLLEETCSEPLTKNSDWILDTSFNLEYIDLYDYKDIFLNIFEKINCKKNEWFWVVWKYDWSLRWDYIIPFLEELNKNCL